MSSLKFQWRNDKTLWVDYSPDLNATILAAWNRGESTVEFHIPGHGDYIINFSEMRQIQKSNSHRWRRIRLFDGQLEVNSNATSTNVSSSSYTQTTQSSKFSSPQNEIVIGT